MGHVDTVGTIVKIDGTQIKGLESDSIPIPDGDTDDKDVSTLDSGYCEETALGMYKPGKVKVSGNTIPGDPGQQALVSAFLDRNLHTFTVQVPKAGDIFTYDAYVSKFTPSSDDQTYKFETNFIGSGPFTRNTSFAGLTSVAAGGAGAVEFPGTIADTTQEIIAYFPNTTASTTLTFTAAASSYIGLSSDNGANYTGINSGTPSSAISLTAGAIVKRLVKIEEEDKATRFVNVYLVRASA